MQPAGGVDDDEVESEVGGLDDRALRAGDRIHLPGGIVHANPRLARDHRQLLDRGRPFDVGRHEQRVLALLGQPLRQLAGRRGLARALQAEQQNHARPFGGGLQPALGVAEQGDHLVADDLDHLLRRRQAVQHVLSHRPVADPVDERLDHLEVDVRFEQRETDLAQRDLDRFGRQPCFAAQRFEDVLQAGAETVEHENRADPEGGLAYPEGPAYNGCKLLYRKPLYYTDESLWPSFSFFVFR